MRKVGGLLLAGALLLPAGAIAAGPAGSATTGLSCTKLGGTVTWTPPVPNNTTKVKSNSRDQGAASRLHRDAEDHERRDHASRDQGYDRGQLHLADQGPTKITVPKGGSILWATTKTKSVLGVLTLTPAGTRDLQGLGQDRQRAVRGQDADR